MWNNLNGVMRGGYYATSRTVGYRSGYRNGSYVRSSVHIGVGFRLNGARRGGAGYGNYEYQVYCERSAYRLYYTKNSVYNTIGFR